MSRPSRATAPAAPSDARLRWSLLVLLGVVSSALGSTAALAQPASSQESAPAAAAVAVRVESDAFASRYAPAIEATRRLAAQRLGEGLPGFSLAVAVVPHGNVAIAGGVADLAAQRPVDHDTLFRIGSTSKPITSALAGRLHDRGLLDFDQPIAEISEVWEGDAGLTMAHLLSNQGGIRHYKGMEPLSRTHYETLRAGLDIFLQDPLLFPPGTDFKYSSYGFNLAGFVLGELAAADYLSAGQREVFTPLGMTSTRADDAIAEIPRRATFYMQRSGETVEVPPVDDSYKWPSGGLLSTPSDMVRFGRAFLAPGYLREATLTRLTTARSTAGKDTGYALGWRVHEGSDALEHRAFHHGGSSVGGRSMLLVVPVGASSAELPAGGFGVVVSILCNSQAYGSKEDDAFEIARGFLAALQSSAPGAPGAPGQ